ncbi:hypothetical protein SAMN05421690_101259 [Nitrosomonas sp. Nm51]|nr:hypothetical protein SAMN05421690_101259 [Nitrosomonas sp. Nm51]
MYLLYIYVDGDSDGAPVVAEAADRTQSAILTVCDQQRPDLEKTVPHVKAEEESVVIMIIVIIMIIVVIIMMMMVVIVMVTMVMFHC